MDDLKDLEANCIPYDICNMDHTNYEEFLAERRMRMAQKIKAFYNSL